MPAKVAVPSPLSLKVMPAGSDPVSVREGVGAPDVVTVREPAVPTVKVAAFALVMFKPLLTVEPPRSKNGLDISQSKTNKHGLALHLRDSDVRVILVRIRRLYVVELFRNLERHSGSP